MAFLMSVSIVIGRFLRVVKLRGIVKRRTDGLGT